MGIKFIENLLSGKWNNETEKPVSCVICSSELLLAKDFRFPDSPFIISNTACQAVTNLASIYYAIKKFDINLITLIESNNVKFKELISIQFQPAEFEFKTLSKIYEENYEILISMYESEQTMNTAFAELNIDTQIETLRTIEPFESMIKEEQLLICGMILDKEQIYGKSPQLYMVNCNGITDPEEIMQIKALNPLPEKLLMNKVKRLHIQI